MLKDLSRVSGGLEQLIEPKTPALRYTSRATAQVIGDQGWERMANFKTLASPVRPRVHLLSSLPLPDHTVHVIYITVNDPYHFVRDVGHPVI